MFKNKLLETIGEIKTPERKLNVMMPVLALLCLAGVVYFLYTQIDNTDKMRMDEKDKRIIELTNDKIQLQHQNDSLILKMFSDKSETVRKLELVIQKQEEQKQQLRGIK